MSFIPYREKRYGKLALILFAVLVLVLACAGIFGGVCTWLYINHWVKYVIISCLAIISIGLVAFAVVLFAICASMTGKTKSVRDGNDSIGVADVRLCDKCGRVISKSAIFCQHCGTKQETGLGMKVCPECKTKNSATASFCEHCGTNLK